MSTKYDLDLLYQLSLTFRDGGLQDIGIWEKYVQRERGSQQRQTKSRLTIFALRPALRLEVKRNQTIDTGDRINQVALTCREYKPPQDDLKSSDRIHPSHKCPLRESL